MRLGNDYKSLVSVNQHTDHFLLELVLINYQPPWWLAQTGDNSLLTDYWTIS